MQRINTDFFRSAAILAGLSFLLHFIMLGGQFMIDDFGFMQAEGLRSEYNTWTDFFTKTRNQHYEPFYNIINTILFGIFSSPGPFLLINLILFYLNCVLLGVFVYAVTTDKRISLIAALLFCAHPINADIISHITFNAVLLSAFFMQLSLILLCFHLQKNNFKLFVLSIGTYIFALLTQAISICFPIYVLCFLYICWNKPLIRVFKLVMPYSFLAGIYLVIWFIMTHATVSLDKKIGIWGFNVIEFIYNLVFLIQWYLGNLIHPTSIVFMHNIEPVALNTVLFGTILIGIIIFSWIIIRNFANNRTFLFGITWFLGGFVFLLPGSISRPNMGIVIEPYWFYFSSMGFFVALACLFSALAKKVRKSMAHLLFVAIMFYWSTCAYSMHLVARTELSYAEYWLEKSPANTIPMMILATLYIYDETSDIPVRFLPQMLKMLKYYMKVNNIERVVLLEGKILKALRSGEAIKNSF